MNKMMRLATAVVAILGLALASCQSTNKMKVTGKNLPTELEGEVVRIYDNSSTQLDSAVISNGSFNLKLDVPSDEQDSQRYLVIEGLTTLTFFAENGKLELVSTPGEGLGTLEFSGDSNLLSMKLQDFSKEMNNLAEPFYNRIQEAYDQIEGEPTEEQVQQLQQIQEEYITVSNNYIQQQYQLNKDNALGAVLFTQIRFETDEQFIAAYEAASDAVKENKMVKERYEYAVQSSKTAVGSQYTDFSMDNGAGATKKLSDYMDGKNYLLVDFFASWCGPCKRSMPEIAELHKEYGDKGLTVLSIGTFEGKGSEDAETQRENHLKAVEEWGIVWESFLDTESTGAKEYGVQGVPTLILISPNGEILVRSHVVNDARVKIEELLKK